MSQRMLQIWFAWLGALMLGVPGLAQDPADEDYPGLLAAAQRKFARGELRAAENLVQELLDAAEEEPEGKRPDGLVLGGARLLSLEIQAAEGNYAEVVRGHAELPGAVAAQPSALRLLRRCQAATGGYAAALAGVEAALQREPGERELQHERGELLLRLGRRREARLQFEANVAGPAPVGARQLAAVGWSQYRLGGAEALERASRSFVDALAADADLAWARTGLGVVKFAAYGEASGLPSGEKDLLKVLETHGDDETALLALYRIRAANGALDPAKTERFLDRVLARNPRCVPALVLRAANVLDDRRHRDAAERLDQVLQIDPNDREALCHRAAAAWLLHDRAAHAAFVARAAQGDGPGPDPDRVLGEHLIALYRFADALPHLEAALQQAPDDVPSLQALAKACIYCGDGARAKQLLLRAKTLSPRLVEPWRNNALAVQDLLDSDYVTVENARFVVRLHKLDAEVLATYLMPLLLEAADVLGAKYQHTPERKVLVEALHTWDDFSVRTIGFRGFTALGACFGPFLTLVSPNDTDLRKQDFMWEATAWHEYTHVLTLGLSRHRVPRWLTEGFSVYEERERDRAWERGMDRELFDAYHNRDIPPIQLLNRLFRGPRILFGYYQGGLLVELIQRRHGFAKALALLTAFGEDLDTEAAFQRALGVGSAVVDAQLLEFVATEKLRGMKLVPRYDEHLVQTFQLRADRDRRDVAARLGLAWACVQRNNPVDAGRWLAEVLRLEPQRAEAQLVRGALADLRGDDQEAIAAWQRGFAAGADDFDARLHCGDALLAQGDRQGAEAMYQAAKACWPACTDQNSSPELRLAQLYRQAGDDVRASAEMATFCRRTARAFQPRYQLAELARAAGRRDEERRWLTECNRIDPFHRELHERLAAAAEALGQRDVAAREFEMAAAVPAALDRRRGQRGVELPEPDSAPDLAQRAGLWLQAARLRADFGDTERAEALLRRIQQEAPESGAAGQVEAVRQSWRGR
jgi:tetratricopeptide (TPR) repeat protein